MATTYLYLDRNSYDANVSMCGNVQNTNSVGAFDNTTYATLEYSDQVGNQNFTWWKFNSSTLNIPLGSTITNVSCDFKCAGDFTNMGTGPGTMQLYYGNDDIYPKGDTADFTQNDYSTFTITQITNGGDWTISELNNVYLKVFGEIPQGITTLHFYGATLTIDYTEPVDYEIGTGAWCSKIGGSWKEIDKMYYKINNAWKEVAYAYRKQDGIWYSISKDVNPIIQADFTGSLAMTFALDNTTNNVTIVSNRGSITNNGLSLTGSSSVGAAYISIPTNTLAKLQTANQDLWFTAQMTPSDWVTSWQSVIQCGFGSNANNRNDNIYNFLQINSPWYTRPQDTDEILIPNNTTRWVKFKLCSNGQRIAHMYDPSTSSWVQKDPKNETSRALWNNSFSYMVFDQCTSGGNLLIAYLKVWTREPSNAEIGI